MSRIVILSLFAVVFGITMVSISSNAGVRKIDPQYAKEDICRFSVSTANGMTIAVNSDSLETIKSVIRKYIITVSQDSVSVIFTLADGLDTELQSQTFYANSSAYDDDVAYKSIEVVGLGTAGGQINLHVWGY